MTLAFPIEYKIWKWISSRITLKIELLPEMVFHLLWSATKSVFRFFGRLEIRRSRFYDPNPHFPIERKKRNWTSTCFCSSYKLAKIILDKLVCRSIFNGPKSRVKLKAGNVFEPRKATGTVLFSHLNCLYTTTYLFWSLFSLVETISLNIWERPLSRRTKCSLPVAVRGSKTLHT